MDIHEKRRERLRQLMEEKFDGKQVLMAGAISRAPDYVSRILSGKKNLGEDLIREIEEALELPGWFGGTAAEQWDADTFEHASWFYELSIAERQRLRTLLIASRFVFDRRRSVTGELPPGQIERRQLTETDVFAGKPPDKK